MDPGVPLKKKSKAIPPSTSERQNEILQRGRAGNTAARPEEGIILSIILGKGYTPFQKTSTVKLGMVKMALGFIKTPLKS